MKKHLLCGLFLIGMSSPFHGPPRDKSEFISAQLAGNQTVVFTFYHGVYRMAQGIAAFPDGGMSKYDVDINMLGTFHIPSGKLTIVRRQKNRDFQPGQGHFHVVMTRGPVALISEAGQVRDGYTSALKHYFLNITTHELTPVRLQEELSEKGYALAEMHIANDDGTLLLISPTLEEHKREMFWDRDASIIPQLWLRYPTGEYVKVAACRHFERVAGDDVIYWQPTPRVFYAFNIKTRQTRPLPGYKHPPYQDVTEGVSVDKDVVKIGVKKDGVWTYTPLPLTADRLRKAR